MTVPQGCFPVTNTAECSTANNGGSFIIHTVDGHFQLGTVPTIKGSSAVRVCGKVDGVYLKHCGGEIRLYLVCIS